jgi:[protein-PII] uridylyltransferase
MGLSTADVAQVEKVVRLHLLLPDTATRRDLSDPQTIGTVAAAVGNASTLALLHALARADAAATGPAAWSDWKGRLIADLVRHVERALDTGVVAPPPSPAAALSAPDRLPAVQLDTDSVSVTAQDRRGLLAAVAGCLSLHRLDVVTADTVTVDGLARMVCAVHARYGGDVDREAIVSDLRRAVTGDLPVAERLAARERSARRGSSAPPRVVWQPASAATDATVLELRATDTPGLLFRVASALEDVGADVRSARISTLGGDVVDAFYLAGEWDPDARSRVEAAVLQAAAPA